ncbi:PspC domain-containing protein [Anaerotignum sp. MB30-C6]|uniref:PspC domain-containing protein n=1 Tax=Anaerotignum sp. MB30-C6 TaxID=3070814 RepID=UPI0027DE685C|nr:PspC domain-containing protein [Anaerotignum sp. MB30-C6]WMI82174.1 PspC domain-containing protein [Anaerotignum sp. MB30-C6]
MTKKLYRSSTDVKISGVCGGIGEYFNTDPTLIRLVWVLASIFTGFFIGLLAYVICVCIIPIDTGYIDGDYTEKN